MSDSNILKIKSDRIIIDGHEPTKEQCETMTLLANALEKSGDFKTIRYESGYAEFEKVGKAEELKFIGAPSLMTMIFDSHITKIIYHGPKDVEFTTSGEEIGSQAYDGTEYLFTVTLETGYVLDTVTLSKIDAAYGTLVSKTDTTFTILAGTGGIYQTITLTSKQATSSTDTKPIFKRVNGTWVKQDAFQRVSGQWVRISSKEEPVPAYTWKCTINNLGSSSPSSVTFNHEGTMPTFEEVTFNGDVFIKIPTMYRKVNTVVDNQIISFTIANGKVDDSYVPYPVFLKEDGTTIMSYVLIGKYLNKSSSSMNSVASGTLKTLAIGTARTYARNRGAGYQLYDWMIQRLWQDLIIVAMNTINTNSGNGINTDALGIDWNSSLYWVDGIVSPLERKIYVSYKPTKYINQVTTSTDGYTSIGYTIPNENGEVQKLGYDVNNPFVNYPSATVSNSNYNTYYCDYYGYTSANRPLVFEFSEPNKQAGAFFWYMAGAWNWDNSLAVRLCYRPVDE